MRHSMMVYELRAVCAGDVELLWRMLTFAASMPDAGSEGSIRTAKLDALLSSYVADWGRAGDFGLVAIGEQGDPIAAGWLRLGDETSSPFKVATASEPELALAVDPSRRGHGIGTALLQALLEQSARRGTPAVVLSVRAENPSVRLYERAGFRVVRCIANRVGGDSLVMRATVAGAQGTV